ncbi:MAG: aromatic ring-hydroxylating dioxygenase subunit alpha [Chloroflexi bacterium]|nr:aromatic ring-hydroxylating dioxygenase subunit alpha [Chloroflexota bacterium]
MLSKQENERLTQVGAGTPAGELMRRYWHPVAATGELDARSTKEVRILGEDLVLYRDLSGGYGLIGARCAHRGTSLAQGVPQEQGLRCMYHGWKYNAFGACTEQPFEDTVRPDGRFKEHTKIAGYPVQELGGLLWSYLGPEPAPLLPRWGPLVWENCVRDIAIAELPCSWLQCQENSLDPVHVEWLHTYFGRWVQERRTGNPDAGSSIGAQRMRPMRHLKIGFDAFEHGIIKRRVLEGFSEEDEDWAVGHPMLFPNTLLVGNEMQATMQWRVPIDDTHTYHVSLYTFRAAPGSEAPIQPRPPYRYVPLFNEAGERIIDLTFNQDYLAWISQGEVANREAERLGESDIGIIQFRKMLKQQIDLVQDGGEPMNVFREPEANRCIELPLERVKFGDRTYLEYSPAEAGHSSAIGDINRVLATWAPIREPAH